jgi:hypothetical protein
MSGSAELDWHGQVARLSHLTMSRNDGQVLAWADGGTSSLAGLRPGPMRANPGRIDDFTLEQRLPGNDRSESVRNDKKHHHLRGRH